MSNKIDSSIIKKIESQASHIIRIYEYDDELECKIAELAREWFLKGIAWSAQNNNK